MNTTLDDQFPQPDPAKPEGRLNILALDLGNNTGFSLVNSDREILHGSVKFTGRKEDRPGQRWVNFRSWLNGTITLHGIHAICFEVVMRGNTGASSQGAADNYGGYKAFVEAAALLHNLELYSVHVMTVKKSWTGSGKAKKEEMIAEAHKRGFPVKTSDEADALGILHWAIQHTS